MKKAKPLSWKPRPYYLPPGHESKAAKAPGDATVLRFCAPACGFHCTMAAHLSAVDAATALCKRLSKRFGKGWKPRVWENLGWHFSAISPCGHIKVHDDGRSKFSAYFGPGETGGRWVGSGRTPGAAVEDALDLARCERNAIQDLLTAAEEVA